MKIGIIGAGFVGLSAGYKLAKAGHDVTIFERSEKPGGLAGGFRAKKWDWSLEEHYHHWFSTDWDVRNLANEIGHEVMFFRPKTSVLIGKSIYQLDSPLSLIKFPHLPLLDRLRTGLTLFYLKTTPFWKPLEKKTAQEYLQNYMGKSAWEVLWKPLFEGKFGKHSPNIPASWFWARIKKRTAALGYPVGGFEAFTLSLANKFLENKGKIIYKSEVEEIRKKEKLEIKLLSKENHSFDKVICTLPTPLFLHLAKDLPDSYKNSIRPLKGIGAVTLILSLKKSFLEDGTYWLNVNNSNYPFLALVEHTNLVDKSHYNNETILYIGNYLEPSHKLFSMTKEQLFAEFYPYLKKVNSKFNEDWVNDMYLFKAPFAQPIVPLNYSKEVPSLATPVENLYLANMQQVYPWDRGTNYAVELGYKVAETIIND